jgi:hypothetical protein
VSELREKTFKNTPKGRSEIPEKEGEYVLLDGFGNEVYRNRTNNFKRRIKEHHYDMSLHFSYIKIRYGRR